MRNKRREHYEDKRLSWRDPNMPVFTLCDLKLQYPDGRTEIKLAQTIMLTPEQRQQASIDCLAVSDELPDWKNDPTYFAKNKRQRK